MLPQHVAVQISSTSESVLTLNTLDTHKPKNMYLEMSFMCVSATCGCRNPFNFWICAHTKYTSTLTNQKYVFWDVIYVCFRIMWLSKSLPTSEFVLTLNTLDTHKQTKNMYLEMSFMHVSAACGSLSLSTSEFVLTTNTLDTSFTF